MYTGHLGVALGASSFRRTIPLWLLLVASQLPDWLDAGMCFVNADRGPAGLYTHGMYVVAATALVLALGYAIATRDAIGCVIVALVAASHYGLDYLTGLKPTWPGGPIIGLHWYQQPVLDCLVETITLVIGWLLYRRSLPASARNSWWAYTVLFSLVALQCAAGVIFFLKVGGQMKC